MPDLSSPLADIPEIFVKSAVAHGVDVTRILDSCYVGWGLIGFVSMANGALADTEGVTVRNPPVVRSLVAEPDTGFMVVADRMRLCCDLHATPGISPTEPDLAVLAANVGVSLSGKRCTRVVLACAGGMTTTARRAINQTQNLARALFSLDDEQGIHKFPGMAIWTNEGTDTEARRIRALILNPAAAGDTPPCGVQLAAACDLYVFAHGMFVPSTLVNRSRLASPAALNPAAAKGAVPLADLT